MRLGFGIWDLGFGILDLGFGIWLSDTGLEHELLILVLLAIRLVAAEA
jgi:hypothetical protein